MKQLGCSRGVFYYEGYVADRSKHGPPRWKSNAVR
jgi:hypothetical protein